ncbi:PREDICTED: nudix hydrolase 7-like [Fragaria vesca subsp. vesca]
MKDHQPLDSEVLSSLLRGSMSQWKQKGKGIWIKVAIQVLIFVDAAVRYTRKYTGTHLQYQHRGC